MYIIVIFSCKFSDCTVPCLHGGTCTNGTCVCPTGFTGEACHEPGMCKIDIHDYYSRKKKT